MYPPTSSSPRRGFAVALTLLLFAPIGLSAQAQTVAAGPAPAPAAKTYASERLWELSETDQRRVIDLEYRDQSGGRGIPDDQMRFYLDQIRFSRWTFSQVKSDIADSLAGQGISDPAGGNTVRCESTDGRMRSCPTTWPGATRLVRQLSSSPCYEGQNWGSHRGEVWVNGGCRAEFAAVDGLGNGEVRCESSDNRQRSCTTPWRNGSRLIRQLSSTPCIEGQNWWNNTGQVMVSGGCRAVFGENPNATAGEVRCESTDGRSRTCPAPWQTESRLVRQVSGTPCVAGRNWWSTPGQIRVSGGCRATFAAAQGPGIGQEIRCESTDGSYRQCGSGLYGTPVLVRQLSDTACTLDRNFGLRNGALWVNLGCRGVFRVQDGSQDRYSVTCSSNDGAYRACTWDHTRGPPRLIRTLSDRACKQGYSWGYNRRANLWVNYGCRGEFAP